MQRSAIEHLRCPKTLRPLRLSSPTIDEDDVLAGELAVQCQEREQGAAPAVYPILNGVPSFVDEAVLQTQTARSFADKWRKHNYYREHTSKFYTQWYLNRYRFGSSEALRDHLAGAHFVLDAGTGMGRDAAFFSEHCKGTVFAVDISRAAVETARQGVNDPRIVFLQADINKLPFPDGFFDFISCDQVIHHTPDPRAAFEHLRRKLRIGGEICCYVYRKKAAIREFVDDYVRERLSGMPIDEALDVCEGITRLGKALAGLKAEIVLEEDIPVLGIKKGTHDVQRFVHWNIMKCFWNDDFDFFTNNIVNFDWYHPEYCFRYTPEEFRAWFAQGWDIQAWDEQEAGISCRARKR